METNNDIQTKSVFHLYSEGTQTHNLFKKENDFVETMNIIAIASFVTGTKILAFCIMNNHFHFVVHCTEQERDEFKKQITSRCKRYVFDDKCPADIRWSYKEINDPEYFKTVVAYVMKNPQEAYYPYITYDYPWSSASLYFRAPYIKKRTELFKTIGSFTQHRFREIVHSRVVLPSDWKITPEGFIWPGSYIDSSKVEAYFKNATNLAFKINTGTKTLKTEISAKENKLNISDEELAQKAREIADDLFGTTKLSKLDNNQRLKIALELVSSYKCSIKAVNRTLHLTAQ